jgi:ABC-type multidrug transport system fused ATPase/permease subunit
MRELFALLIKVLRHPLPAPTTGSRWAEFFEEPKAFHYADLNRLWPFVAPHWKKWLVASGLMLVGTLLSLPQPLFSKYVIDDVVLQRDLGLLHFIILAMVALVLAGMLVGFVQGFYFLRFQQDVIFEIQQRLFDRVLRLPKAFFDSKQTGYLMSRVAGDVFRLQTLFSSSVVQLVPSLLKLVGGVGILLYLNWRLALLALLILPFYLAITRTFAARVRKFSWAAMERSALVFRDLQQSLSGMSLIKMFATESREQQKLQESLRESIAANVEQNVVSSVSGLLTGLMSSLGMILLLWFGAQEIIRERMTLGDFVAFNAYLAYLYGPAQLMASMSLTLQTSFAALERVFALFDVVPEDDGDDYKPKVVRIAGRITFEHVSFCYDGRKEVLSDISFTTEPGDLIALVGPSGAGKSTLVSLVIQLYKPSSGKILIDGVDVSQLSLKSVRERIGIVSQDVFLFDTTIKDNIRYARPDASEEEVRQAAELAAAHEFIEQLPEGYDTKVGERGVRLSAGQRQRLSLARAILKNPDVLILDEPTSALDSPTEAVIKEALRRFARGRTTFVIAHRLSTVLWADKILVLDGGRIIQAGTHSELVRQAGLYQRMCQEQFLIDAFDESHEPSKNAIHDLAL